MGTTKEEKTKMVPKKGTMNNTERDKNGTQNGYHKNRNDRLVPKMGTINLAGKREWYPKWVP